MVGGARAGLGWKLTVRTSSHTLPDPFRWLRISGGFSLLRLWARRVTTTAFPTPAVFWFNPLIELKVFHGLQLLSILATCFCHLVIKFSSNTQKVTWHPCAHGNVTPVNVTFISAFILQLKRSRWVQSHSLLPTSSQPHENPFSIWIQYS